MIRLPHRLACGLACVLGLFHPQASAQEKYRTFAPAKDVAMLVDVSVSVKKDAEGHAEARSLIQSIVAGEGLATSKFKDSWNIDPNPDMAALFGAYLGLPATAESAELRPLMEVNNTFLSMHIGTVETVLTQGKYLRLRRIQEIKDMIKGGYPSTAEMDDKSTCFWFTMARAARILSQNSKLGYYLFVVSDEEDDPDYRPDGPPGHTEADYVTYTKGLSQTYPEPAIRNEIGRYFDYRGKNSRNVDLYQPRGDFKQVLIAKFSHTDYRDAKSRVKIAWYAMGVEPERVKVLIAPDPVAPPPVDQPLAPVAYQPPKLEPAVQWLGGLKEVARKSFNYHSPLLVWQVKNAEAASYAPNDKPSLVVSNRPRPVKKLTSSRNDLQTARLPAEMEDGNAVLSLRLEQLESDEVRIEVRRPSLFWLHCLAWISAVLALGVFLYSWRSLRQPPMRRSAPARA